jgi:hypothetical protein
MVFAATKINEQEMLLVIPIHFYYIFYWHDDTQHNDTQHKELGSAVMLNVFMTSVMVLLHCIHANISNSIRG